MLMPMLIRNMELAGFHIVLPEDEEDKNIKDVALIVESLRSLMCKYYEIKHPFQDISEEIFQYNDDGSFALAKTLEMDFSEFEISIMEQPES
jgi:hypothetical protein